MSEPLTGQSPAGATRARWLRIGVLGAMSAVLLAGLVILAYQLALARVPQHRATLERLVRAQTGLDVRFDELTLRWGWYGPEAVFKRVELGEPGRSNVLLRAPQLTVGFDAWRSVRTGQLQPGRITLVAPRIDLTRPSITGPREREGDAQGLLDSWLRAPILRRWRGGRIDIESGTLSVPAPGNPAHIVSLLVRRASMRRTDDTLSASASLLLPERMGRVLTLSMQLERESAPSERYRGVVRVQGRRLEAAGWREFLGAATSWARLLPRGGSGEANARLELRAGQVVRADGELRAEGVSFAALERPDAQQAPIIGAPLYLGPLRASWKLERNAQEWRLRLRDLRFGPAAREMPAAAFDLTWNRTERSAQGTLDSLPAASLASVARWLAPHLSLGGIELGGTARDVAFRWDGQTPAGERLRVEATLDALTLTAPSRNFVLSGLGARVTGGETSLTVELEAPAAQLTLAGAPESITGLELRSTLELARAGEGWVLTTDRLSVSHESARGELAGALRAAVPEAEPELAVRVRLAEADVAALRSMLGDFITATFGPAATGLAAGRIENARFDLNGPVRALPFALGAAGFNGTLELREGRLSPPEPWSEIVDIEGRLAWRGSSMQLDLDRARSGPFALEAVEARWRADEPGGWGVTGQASARLEEALPWLTERTTLQEYVPHAGMLLADGEVLLDFDVAARPAPDDGSEPPRPQVRLALSLEGARLQPTPALPPIEAVRGALAFDDGRLQRSTLTARWLGGPATLRVIERVDAEVPVLTVAAQGTLDARQLAAVLGLGTEAAVAGNTSWEGELRYRRDPVSGTGVWQARAESSLEGVASRLPAPFAKEAAARSRLRIEASGEGESATLRVSLADRFRGAFALFPAENREWRIARGAAHFGSEAVEVPAEPVVRVAGRIERLDLPAYLAAWRRLQSRADAPPISAALAAGELLVGKRGFADARLEAGPADEGFELRLSAEGLEGTVQWPREPGAEQPVRVELVRLVVPADTKPIELVSAAAALGPATTVLIQDLTWSDRAFGRVTASVQKSDSGVAVDELRLVRASDETQATVRCDPQLSQCRVDLQLESRDAAATLRELGFHDSVAAKHALMRAELDWRPQEAESPLETLSGTLNVRLRDGVARGRPLTEGRDPALLVVPALLRGAAAAEESEDSAPAALEQNLSFSELTADFELRDGRAATSNLHFDGDAEIIVRGRVGLLERDYDLTAWVLRGEERLPAALRRMGPTARVAAAWLALREFFGGRAGQRSRTVLRLRGTWDSPVVELQAAASDDADVPRGGNGEPVMQR